MMNRDWRAESSISFLFHSYTHTHPPPHLAGALSDDARMTSVRLTTSAAYIGHKSTTERPRKTKVDTLHVTGTPLSRSKGQRSRSTGRFGWLFKSPHKHKHKRATMGICLKNLCPHLHYSA